jgi:hypothetical protein
MAWFGWGWDGSDLACVELYDLYNPFVDHTLRLIQHNWVVLAYNHNIVILVLIIGESSIGVISTYHFISVLSLLLPGIIILFLHLLSTNPKCTQPCYSNLLLRRRWTGILRRGVLGYVLPRLSFLCCYRVFCCSVPLSHHSLWRHYLCNNYSLFMTFGYLWTLLGRMCGTIDHGSCIRWVLGFVIKIRYDRSGTRAVSTIETLA